MAKVLIEGGRIVTAVDDYVADVLIENGKIEAIARTLQAEDAAVPRSSQSRRRLWLAAIGHGRYLSRSASGRVL